MNFAKNFKSRLMVDYGHKLITTDDTYTKSLKLNEF